MGTALLRHSANRRSLLWPPRVLSVLVFALLALWLTSHASTAWGRPPTDLQAYLQERFHLSASQARGALGALLVYAHQRLQKSDFDDFAAHVPNAAHIMQVVKQQGIVTGPLDDIDEYERTLASVEIGQPLASQIAPAVIEWLGAAGYSHERDILTAIVR
ncbi:MAG TPA: DUF2780 domain-containing protein [Steroidobacteraceae bacterium]|jgi:hypothetical protein